MLVKLQNIGSILFGSYQKSNEKDGVSFLQVSHFDDSLEPSLLKESYVIPEPKEIKSILQANDVVLVSKGSKILAWAYDVKYGEVLPSSIFFIIRPKTNQVLGKYLAYYLNSEKVLHELKSLGAGVTVTSISKKDLLQLNVWLPNIEEQKNIVKIIDVVSKDVKLTKELLNKKTTLKRGVINKLLNNELIKET